MCAGVIAGDYARVAVFDGQFATAVLARRSRLPGYCEAIWKHEHVADPSELSAEAAAGYWGDVAKVARAISTVFQPMKINYMTFGNWVPHLHTHVVPRYQDDPAPGNPISWDAMFQDEPVPEEELRAQRDRLRNVL